MKTFMVPVLVNATYHLNVQADTPEDANKQALLLANAVFKDELPVIVRPAPNDEPSVSLMVNTIEYDVKEAEEVGGAYFIGSAITGTDEAEALKLMQEKKARDRFIHLLETNGRDG